MGLLEKYWGFGIAVGGNQNYPQSCYLKMIWGEKYSSPFWISSLFLVLSMNLMLQTQMCKE